ncbi:hypothetical protein BDQ17DRAFT_1433399 [Cyathus striatus]|nr:hypothetical protein BDQ17DRAFT_1433399 [Cyathus striatus]
MSFFCRTVIPQMGSSATQPSLKFPPRCNHCGTLSGGILNDIPNNPVPYALSRKHYVPGTTERSQIQALISRGEAFLRTAEAELSTLASCVSDTQAYNTVLHSLLSPIHQLPNDVLGEIFSYLCEDYTDVGEPYGHIWVLRQVCTHWRNVVDSRSLFWRNIKLGYSPKVHATLIKHCFRTFMELSRGAQLRVSFLAKNGLKETFYKEVKDILDESNRWVSLETTNSFMRYHVVLTSLWKCGLTNLRNLSLCGGLWKDYTDLYIEIFRGATSVENLQLERANFSAVLVTIPMNNLRKLTLKDCVICPVEDRHSTSFWPKLNSLFSLEELTWDYCNYHGIMPTMAITFPSLHTLSIRNQDIRDNSDIWTVIHAPKLSNLKLDFLPSDSAPAILSIVPRSKCVIKQLEVSFRASPTIYTIEELSDVEELQYHRECKKATFGSGSFSVEGSDTSWRGVSNKSCYRTSC